MTRPTLSAVRRRTPRMVKCESLIVVEAFRMLAVASMTRVCPARPCPTLAQESAPVIFDEQLLIYGCAKPGYARKLSVTVQLTKTLASNLELL